MSAMTTAPERGEAADYYFTYIDKVPPGDIRVILNSQLAEMVKLLGGIGDDDSLYRYADDKWSIREMMSHINDTERVFVFRALWFARGFDSPLPSFDQDIAVQASGADARSWSSHIEEFRAVREATVTFFDNLAEEAWTRRGIASGNPFTVRALAFITAGHVAHHIGILQSKYLQSDSPDPE